MSRHYSPKGQAAERLTVVNKRKTISIDEAGDVDEVPTTLYLDTTGEILFTYLLPPFVTQALDQGDRATGKTAEDALEAYKTQLHAYAQWKRTAMAELVIIAQIKYEGTTAAGGRSIMSESEMSYSHRSFKNDDDFVLSDKHMVAVRHIVAFRVNRNFYEVDEVDGTRVPGTRITYSDITRDGTVLPYSDELVAKLDQVAAAIDQAARVLHSIAKAEDISKALLGLGNGGMLRLVA